MKGNSFRLELDGLEQDFDEWKFWHGPKGGPQYALHVVPPLVLTITSNNPKTCFLNEKNVSSSHERK